MTPAQAISEIVKSVIELATVGTNLLDLEKRAETSIALYGAQSAIKRYQPKWAKIPFPSAVCLSVNDTIGHGIPFNYNLQDGDLLSIDCGIVVGGVAADCGLTIPIGKVSSKDEYLLKVTKEILYKGIEVIKPGVRISEVGKAMQYALGSRDFVISHRMASHQIGTSMHEEPTIPNFDIGMFEVVTVDDKGRKKYSYEEFKDVPSFYEGQIVCIEPHVTYKDYNGYIASDYWSLKTRDGKKSAFAEHMVRVTSMGNEILTSHFK